MDINVGGKPIKAVAEPTKQGYLFVFDRITGKPVMAHRRTRRAEGKCAWRMVRNRHSRFPTRPAPYARTGVTPDVLIDFTPGMHQQAPNSSRITNWAPSSPHRWSADTSRRSEPWMLGRPMGAPIGQAVHSIRKITPSMFTPAIPVSSRSGLVPPAPELSDIPYVVGVAGKKPSMINAAGTKPGGRRSSVDVETARSGCRRRRGIQAADCQWTVHHEAAVQHHQRHRSGHGLKSKWQVAHG